MAAKTAAILCATLVAVSVLAGSNEPPAGAKVIQAPQLKAGSWWVIKNSSGEVTRKLIEVKGDKFVILHGKDKRVVTNEWNGVETTHASRGIPLTFSPHTRTLSFPLWEGKEWGGSVRIESVGDFINRGFLVVNQVRARAVAWEKIFVPAGEFEALRVENTIGTMSSTCWYSAEVEYFVKCESSDSSYSFELVRYQLAK